MSLTSQYQTWRAGLQAAVNQALVGEVFNVASQEILSAVQTEVYEEYTPKIYERRRDDGGLYDPENITFELDAAEMQLTVRNEAPRETGNYDSGFVAEIVESGKGYIWPPKGVGARPFHSVAEESLISDGKAEKALAEGLMRQGYIVIFE